MNWCGELVRDLLVGDVGVVFDVGEDEVLLPLVEFRRSPRWFLLLSPLSSHLLPESESSHCYPIHSSNFLGAFPESSSFKILLRSARFFCVFGGSYELELFISNYQPWIPKTGEKIEPLEFYSS